MARKKKLLDNDVDEPMKAKSSKVGSLKEKQICIAHYLNAIPTETEKTQFLGLYLERVLVGKSKLYWHLENRLACKVQKISVLNRPTLLPYIFAEFSKRLKKKLKAADLAGQVTRWDDPDKGYFVADTMDVRAETSPYRLYRRISKTATGIHGKMALEIDDRNLVMTEWVRSLISSVRKNILSSDGVIVSRDGISWQLVECINNHPFVSIHFPDIKEVYVLESEMDNFLKEISEAKAKEALLDKERNGYLRIIGAMMVLLSKSTKKSFLDKGIISENIADEIKKPPYRIESDVIDAIGTLFPSTSGLKKSNMQEKLKDAKDVFGLPDVWPDEE